MSIRKMILPLLGGAMLGGAMLAVPAAASAAPHSVTVSYADLNLASADGRTELNQRLDRAIRLLCGGVASRTISETNEKMQCRDEANANVRQAVVKIVEGRGSADRTLALRL